MSTTLLILCGVMMAMQQYRIDQLRDQATAAKEMILSMASELKKLGSKNVESI